MDSKKRVNMALTVGLGFMLLAGLFVLSRNNFLLFHSIIELFSITVAWSVFLLVWNTRRIGAEDALVFLGIAYFFIGFIDLFHMLAYKGMGLFGESGSSEYATQLWIAARVLEATCLFAFPFIPGHRLQIGYVLAGFTAFTAGVFASIFIWHTFPHCFIEGQGLTAFKKGAEYAICLVITFAMLLLYHRRENLDDTVFRLMLVAMACTVAAEISFTFYISVYGLSNVLGHLFKIVSFFFVYLALVHSSVSRPYETLFKQQKQLTDALQGRERYLSGILQTTVDGFWEVDSRGRISEVNNAYCVMSGYTDDEIIGLKITDLDALESPGETAARMARIILNGSEVFETKHRRKDGGIWPVEISTTHMGDHGGRFICFSRDLTERNRQLEALRKSENEYRSTMNGLRAGVVVHADDTRILISNPEAGRILGLTQEQMTGKKAIDPAWEFVHEDLSIMKVEDYPVNRVLSTEKPLHDYLLGIKRPDRDHVTWAIVNAIPVFSRNHELEKVIVNFQDITDRRGAEDALKESRVFLENMSDIAYTADDRGNLTWVNQAIERKTGFSSEKILGQPFLPLFITADHASIMDVYKRTLMGESLENSVTFTSGITCHITSLPRWNDKGKIIGTFGVARDITERLKVEKSLQISEDRLKKAQITAKIGTWEYDISTGQVWGSEEAFRLYGIERTSEYLPLDEVENQIMEAERVNQALVDLITRDKEYDIEFEITQKDTQQQIVIHSIAELVKDDEGNPVKVLGVIQDITDKKAKEVENLKLLEQLKLSQKMESIGTLAGGIAHDFNNILFPIAGLSELLLEDLPPESLEYENIQQILKAAERGRDLVEQILALSRRSEQEIMPFRVQTILEEALKLSRASIPSYIDIFQDIENDCGLVMGDPTKIHQVVMNLMTNAYHAVEQISGKIRVYLKKITRKPGDLPTASLEPGSYVILSISDTGCGIDPETMEKIFDPYFTTKEQGKGTGLGLAVVFGIIKEHGGDIRVHSELGKGSTFHVYLPLMEDSEVAGTGKKPDVHATGGERILLVDDEEPIIFLEKQMLERLGYKVKTATDSVDALNMFKSDPDGFDLVITDVAMPEMPGDQLAEALLSIKPDIPIIICTGFSNRISRQEIEAQGIRGFLKKPIPKSKMARMVRNVLDEDKRKTSETSM